MRGIGFLVALGFSWFAAGGAHAQVRDGDVRLYLDASLLTWTKQITEAEGAGLSSEEEITTIGSGLLGAGGVGVGYAVSPYLLPELYVSLQNAKIDTGDGDVNLRQWELRPCLEVPLLPDQRFVPFLMGGMTLGRTVTKGDSDDDDDVTMFGLGPALGAGAHAFITERASLDLSLVFRGTFFVKNDLADALPDGVDLTVKQYTLLLNLGASFWL
jgi:hypothetical protein